MQRLHGELTGGRPCASHSRLVRSAVEDRLPVGEAVADGMSLFAPLQPSGRSGAASNAAACEHGML